jgi:hypothetical protein
MRFSHAASTLLTVVLACGGGGIVSGDGPNTVPVDKDHCAFQTPAPTCESALDVASADEVIAFITALTEFKFASTTSDSGAKLVPTRNLRATTDIELDVAPLRGPNVRCTAPDAGEQRCSETWAFTGEKTEAWNFPVVGGNRPRALPGGVACANAECTKITIAARTVVRFQRAFELLEFGQTYEHQIRVVRACGTTCESTEVSCATTTTCLDANSFCALCQGRSNEVCACQTRCTAKGKGAACTFVSSDDTGDVGTCNAEGTCQ